MSRTVISLLAPVALLMAGCGQEAAEPASEPTAQAVQTDEGPAWDDFVSGYIERYFELNPPAGVTAGRHEFDGRLPDLSEAGIARAVQWLRDAQQRARGFGDDALGERERFERDHLIAASEALLFNLVTSDFVHTNPVFYSNFTSPSTYITVEYAPLHERMQAYTAYATALPAYLNTMRANLQTPLALPYIETALGIFSGLSSYLQEDVPAIFADVADENTVSSFERANRAAVQALDGTAEWLEAQRETATDNYALGTERFLQMLRQTEGVEISLAELKAAGEADLERNLAALEAACEDFAPGVAPAECIAKAESDKPEGGPVAGARRQLDDLRAFVEEEQLVSIPGPERAEVEEAPPYARFNLAYIEIPGPYEKKLPSVYYIAPPDESWPEAQQNAYIPGEAELLFISVHEVWPGHFLHYLHANRAASEFARLFQTYTFTEGWAHYTEEMMWDAGLRGGDPQAHIGQLTNALLRNVRYLSAIGLHTGGMSVEESKRMFEESAFQDAGNAIQQARRGTYDPGYLNYTLGKLIIKKLREDWTAERGGREAWQEFHDAFLSFGGPPIPLVRRVMLGDDYAGDDDLLRTNSQSRGPE
ncbi:MAG: DUF885 domain-containing protein [Gammaproteobacteria bacterium]|nr:DUF885 domain-containing protein [Gammaproteobacteria bacterium]